NLALSPVVLHEAARRSTLVVNRDVFELLFLRVLGDFKGVSSTLRIRSRPLVASRRILRQGNLGELEFPLHRVFQFLLVKRARVLGATGAAKNKENQSQPGEFDHGESVLSSCPRHSPAFLTRRLALLSLPLCSQETSEESSLKRLMPTS